MKVNIGGYPNGEEPRLIDINIEGFDVWEMYYTLALIISPMLKQLKETKNGVPGCMPAFDNDFYDWNTHPEEAEAQLKEAEKQWNEILDKMIYSFDKIISDDFYDNRSDPKIQEGIDLFAKYYFDLWD